MTGDQGELKQLSQNELFPCLTRRSRSGGSTLIQPIQILPFLRRSQETTCSSGEIGLLVGCETKIPEFQGTHSWRETLINHLVNSGYSNRIVEMLTGKTGHTPFNQYSSDDLASMQKAIDEHAAYMNLPSPS